VRFARGDGDSYTFRDSRPKISGTPEESRHIMGAMELNGGLCTLRPWHPADVESLVYNANNRKIWVNMRDGFPHPYMPADALDWINRARAAQPVTNFAIVVSGAAVGGLGFELKTDIERYSAEVGYWLGEAFWGRGIVTAALRTMTQYALKTYGLNRIFALPFSGNQGSIRVLEKAGYRWEGILRRSAFKDGRFRDQEVYAFVVDKRDAGGRG
jgi:RimJ/RimL family protein N-acetyltransferase